MPTISEAINEGSARLREAGVVHERLDASLLLGHVTGLDRTRLLTRSDEHVDETCYREYLAHIEQRAAGQPLQYLIGRQEFYGLHFIVTPDVLIPRPETEFLIDRVIKAVQELNLKSPLIADIGTGSGCIAVTLAKQLPDARLIATDLSSAALNVARTNAALNRVADRIEFVEGDLVTPFAERGSDFCVDVLASNPPYVPDDNRETLQREVRDWEPGIALFGGIDGLDFYRRLAAEGSRHLKPGSLVILEIGFSQLEQIQEIFKGGPLELLDITRDLQGIPRTLCLRKTA